MGRRDGQVTRRALLAGAAAMAARAAVPGSVLVHEHIMVDFIGADRIAAGRYDADEVFRIAKSKIEEVKALGCVRLLECTPNYIGRDARLVQRLSDATGVELWTNTGLYGAANHKYVPAFAREETAEQLARRWVREARDGIDGVKPRFIKSGVNKGPLDALDRKLVRAAAIAARETGFTVAIHTGDGKAAIEEADIFTQEGVPLSRLVWVHAQNEKDLSIHERLARIGVWIAFDGVNARSAAWHEECVRKMAARRLLNRTLISQDSGWYRVGEPGGGQYNGYTYLYTDFLPRLDAAWVQPLLVGNPRAAFSF